MNIVNRMIRIVTTLAAVCAAAETPGLLQPGNPGPTFSLPSLSEGRVSLRFYCGDTLLKPHINNIRHIVVLSFWATYCKPCQREIPELMKFAEKHAGDSIKLFCISIDREGERIVAPFVKEKGYTLPVLLDPYRKTAERYGVASLPALFVLDERSIIRYASVGFRENDPLDVKLEGIVSDIRAGRTVTIVGSVSGGESVAVEADVASATKPQRVLLTAKNRWDAIVAVECGMSLEKLADSLEVEPQVIKGWYADLKKAATKLWEKPQLK
ncbi:MAG: TlpA family protein disulfide reductase [Chitinispirillaceae bacterium]|nr:TlpA family protein disulfide reductase [Chitinispirillaceae bacterium]